MPTDRSIRMVLSMLFVTCRQYSFAPVTAVHTNSTLVPETFSLLEGETKLGGTGGKPLTRLLLSDHGPQPDSLPALTFQLYWFPLLGKLLCTDEVISPTTRSKTNSPSFPFLTSKWYVFASSTFFHLNSIFVSAICAPSTGATNIGANCGIGFGTINVTPESTLTRP